MRLRRAYRAARLGRWTLGRRAMSPVTRGLSLANSTRHAKKGSFLQHKIRVGIIKEIFDAAFR